MATPPGLRYFESRAMVYRHTWRGSAISTFLNPIFYLAAMGLGLGTLVDEGTGRAALDQVRYLDFLAPGLLAATAMQTGTGDASYPVMAGIKWIRTYEAALATPIGVRDLTLGHLAWVALRLLVSSLVFVVIMMAFGAVDAVRGLTAVGPAILTGLAFAGPVMAYTATLKDAQGLAGLFRFAIVPMFLLSGTFFPIDQLPGWLQPVAYFTPLWHGVELSRGIALGAGTTLVPALHAGYLVAWAVVGAAAASHLLGRRLIS